MIGKRRRAQSKWTHLAKGEPCLIRLPGICDGGGETTAPCHFRMAGLSGFGFIPDAIFVAWGCAACHRFADAHHDAETQLALAQAVFRTQAELLRRGVLIVKGAKD